MPNYTLKINGKSVSFSADADTPLLWVLRDELDMVGTKFGCGIAQCGACTVHLDGNAIRSCQLQVSMIDAEEITTIKELISKDQKTDIIKTMSLVDDKENIIATFKKTIYIANKAFYKEKQAARAKA